MDHGWLKYSYHYLGFPVSYEFLGFLTIGGVFLAVALGAIGIILREHCKTGVLVAILCMMGLGTFCWLSGMTTLESDDSTRESIQAHLENKYQVKMADPDQKVYLFNVDDGVLVDTPGDEKVWFTVDKDNLEDEAFKNENGKTVDIDSYRALDVKAIADEVADVSALNDPEVSFAQSEMNARMASENSDAVLASGEVDGEKVRATVLVDDHGKVRDVRVQGKSLMK